jgi:SnoaL-like domain
MDFFETPSQSASMHRAQAALSAVQIDRAFSRRAALAVATSILVGFGSASQALSQGTNLRTKNMSDPRVKTYQTYLSAWSAIADIERERLLRESVTDAIVFTNPTQTRRGVPDVIAHLREFQIHSPGGSFRMIEMLGYDTHGIATWQFFDAREQPGFRGYDVLAFDAQGRIESILMFVHVEKQILK